MYGGAVISCSTSERATVTVEDWDCLELEVAGETHRIRSEADLKQNGRMFDAILAAIEYFELEGASIRISVVSDIPVRAGLSGSTAVMTALVAALLEWMDATGFGSAERFVWGGNAWKSHHLLAEIVRHIELYFLKIVCGYQDAYMCTFGSLNFLDFGDKQHYLSLDREPLGTVEDLSGSVANVPIILVHTGVQRVSGAVHKPVRDRWIEGDTHVVNGMLRLAHIARMAKLPMIRGDWDRLGELMTENHEITRSFGSSSAVNERIISLALESGAVAAKLAGAGRGGTVIALNPDPGPMIEALQAEKTGRVLYPLPSDGVRREEIPTGGA